MDAKRIMREGLQNLKQPVLMIRSVVKDDIWKKCKQLYKSAGLNISNPENLQMIYLDGDPPVRVD